MTCNRIPHAALSLAALLVTACGGDVIAPDAAPAAVMLGEWTYSRRVILHDHPSLNTGLSVTIAIDSAAAVQFWGRVTFWFAGDVGVPAARFGPVSGRIGEDRRVALMILAAAADVPALTIIGEIDGDIVVVRESWAGTDRGPFPAGAKFQRLH